MTNHHNDAAGHDGYDHDDGHGQCDDQVPVNEPGRPEPVLLPEPIEFEDYEGCEFCLGGFSPLAVHPVLGPVYTACSSCQDLCGCCNGIGLFPANTTCPDCLQEALAHYGMTVRFCHSCAGVLAVEGLGVGS